MRLLQFTDCHLYADRHARLGNLCTYDSLVKVMKKAAEQATPPELIVFTGDLVDDGSARGYQHLADLIATSNVPTFCLPGNHDAPLTMQKHLHGRNIFLSSTTAISAWRFIFLDTHVPGKNGGALSAEKLSTLQQTLSNATEKNVLVFLHHPPVAIGSLWMDAMGLENGEALLRVLAAYPAVRGAVAGHVHQAFSAERNGLKLLASPSTGVQFKPGASQFERDDLGPGYRWFELHDDGTFETGIERVD
jgi:Icc protein